MSSPERRYPRSSFFYPMDNCDAAFELSQASGEEPPPVFSQKGSIIHSVLGRKPPKEKLEDAEAGLGADLDVQRSKFLTAWLNGHEIEFELIEERLWMRKGLKPLYSGQPD